VGIPRPLSGRMSVIFYQTTRHYTVTAVVAGITANIAIFISVQHSSSYDVYYQPLLLARSYLVLILPNSLNFPSLVHVELLKHTGNYTYHQYNVKNSFLKGAIPLCIINIYYNSYRQYTASIKSRCLITTGLFLVTCFGV